MKCNIIMAILVDNRSDIAPKVQEVLTNYGCIIDTRLGMHQSNDCSEEGLIILKLCGDSDQISKLEEELKGLDRVAVNKMKIEFED